VVCRTANSQEPMPPLAMTVCSESREEGLNYCRREESAWIQMFGKRIPHLVDEGGFPTCIVIPPKPSRWTCRARLNPSRDSIYLSSKFDHEKKWLLSAQSIGRKTYEQFVSIHIDVRILNNIGPDILRKCCGLKEFVILANDVSHQIAVEEICKFIEKKQIRQRCWKGWQPPEMPIRGLDGITVEIRSFQDATAITRTHMYLEGHI
jgi:hypothetical protein